jgi:hypothetical protein
MDSNRLGWMEHQAQGSIIRSRRRNYLSIGGYKTERWSVLNSYRPLGVIASFVNETASSLGDRETLQCSRSYFFGRFL